ncbi:MAG: hypothetical protein O3A63_05295 [Proteobacteria bacterium]|nr:hypothetical protein [Pseudomonadota bacterium]
MEEQFRLLFKGEVVEGQHKAVVKKRLAQILKLDDAGLERLFSGATITVKKQVDRATAARYQQAFKQSGAQLLVVRVALDEGVKATPEPDRPELTVLPHGSDVLRPDERANTPDVDIDVSHLEVVDGPLSDPSQSSVHAPDVSHITLAEVGVRLGDPQNIMEIEIATDFVLAEPGADMSTSPRAAAPPPPDTSHLKLDD